MGGLVRGIVLFVVLLLGAAGGAWLSLAAAYLLTVPAERTTGGAAFAAVLALLVLGLALLARWVHGARGLTAFVIVVLLSAFLAGLVIS